MLGFTKDEFWSESRKLWTLAWPVAMSGLLYVLPNQIHLAVLGHFNPGHHNLAALSLAGSFMNMTVSTFAAGFAGAIATIGGQAYGQKSLKVIGLILQKTMLLLSLMCIPLAILYYFGEKFFLLLKQDPAVARLAGRYCKFHIIALWPGLNFQAILIFLQCQGIVLLDLYVNIFVNIVNAAMSYFVIVHWRMGLDGVIIADCFNTWLFFLSICFLVWWNGIHKDTIPPLSREIFRNWRKIFEIAVPGALMICTETWLFEILSFVAGIYGALPQSVYGLSFQIVMVPLIVIGGIVVAVATRVSNCLGAGDDHLARVASCVAFVIVLFSAVVYAIICGLLRDHIGKIFSTDPHVVSGLSQVIPVIIIIMLFSVVQQVIAAVLHGAGKQCEGSIANVIGYDFVALPASLLLAKYWNLSKDAALSIWWGVSIGVVAVFIAMLIIFLKMDWKHEVEKAAKRISEHTEHLLGTEEPKTPSANYV